MTWQWEKLKECVERRFFSGERLTVAQFRLKAGYVVQRHSHPKGRSPSCPRGFWSLRWAAGGSRRPPATWCTYAATSRSRSLSGCFLLWISADA
jgi:hypothetical protein